MNDRMEKSYRLVNDYSNAFMNNGAERERKTSIAQSAADMIQSLYNIYEVNFCRSKEMEPTILYYAWGLGSDCLDVYENNPDRKVAVVVFRTIMLRLGLLSAIFAARKEQLDNEIHYLQTLANNVVKPIWKEDRYAVSLNKKLFFRLVSVFSDQMEQSADDIAKELLCEMGVMLQERDTSSVLQYGHPIDSGIVNLLDTPVINGAFRKLVDFNADTLMGQMLASSIPVTRDNYAGLNTIVDECVETLHIRRPYVIVTNQLSGMNAITFGSDGEPYIAITSLLNKIMSPDEMRFIIGHECGHIAMGHVVYHTAATVLGSFSQMIPVIGSAVYGTISFPLKAWSRRSEITADWAGLVCCRDLNVAQKALLHIESAYMDVEEVNIDEYMNQSKRYLNDGIMRKVGEYKSEHPLTPKRIEALDIFAKSIPYYEAVGRDIPVDAVSKKDLDDAVENIVRVL